MLNSKGSLTLVIIVIVLVTLILIGVGSYFIYQNGQLKVENKIQALNEIKEITPKESDQKLTTEFQSEPPIKELIPTNQEKTYLNSKFRFSINIPSNWSYQEYSPTNILTGIVDTQDPGGNKIKPGIGHGIHISIYENEFEDLYTFAPKHMEVETIEQLFWKKVNYGGLEGLQTEFACQSSCSSTFLKKEGLVIQFEGRNVDVEEASPILRSLKFE